MDVEAPSGTPGSDSRPPYGRGHGRPVLPNGIETFPMASPSHTGKSKLPGSHLFTEWLHRHLKLADIAVRPTWLPSWLPIRVVLTTAQWSERLSKSRLDFASHLEARITRWSDTAASLGALAWSALRRHRNRQRAGLSEPELDDHNAGSPPISRVGLTAIPLAGRLVHRLSSWFGEPEAGQSAGAALGDAAQSGLALPAIPPLKRLLHGMSSWPEAVIKSENESPVGVGPAFFDAPSGPRPARSGVADRAPVAAIRTRAEPRVGATESVADMFPTGRNTLPMLFAATRPLAMISAVADVPELGGAGSDGSFIPRALLGKTPSAPRMYQSVKAWQPVADTPVGTNKIEQRAGSRAVSQSDGSRLGLTGGPVLPWLQRRPEGVQTPGMVGLPVEAQSGGEPDTPATDQSRDPLAQPQTSSSPEPLVQRPGAARMIGRSVAKRFWGVWQSDVASQVRLSASGAAEREGQLGIPSGLQARAFAQPAWSRPGADAYSERSALVETRLDDGSGWADADLLQGLPWPPAGRHIDSDNAVISGQFGLRSLHVSNTGFQGVRPMAFHPASAAPGHVAQKHAGAAMPPNMAFAPLGRPGASSGRSELAAVEEAADGTGPAEAQVPTAVDIDSLARDVYQLLKRRLALEQERLRCIC